MTLTAIGEGQVSVSPITPPSRVVIIIPGIFGGSIRFFIASTLSVGEVDAEATEALSPLSWQVGPCPGVLPGFLSIQSFIFWIEVNALYSFLEKSRLATWQASSSALVNTPRALAPLPPPYPPAPWPGAGPRCSERTVATWRALMALAEATLR